MFQMYSKVIQFHIYIHTHILLFPILFHHGLLLIQDIEYRSLCYMVGPCGLSIWYTECVSLNPKFPIYSSPPPWEPSCFQAWYLRQELWSQAVWIGILALSLSNWVTLGKHFISLSLGFLFLQNRKNNSAYRTEKLWRFIEIILRHLAHSKE